MTAYVVVDDVAAQNDIGASYWDILGIFEDLETAKQFARKNVNRRLKSQMIIVEEVTTNPENPEWPKTTISRRVAAYPNPNEED